MKHIISFIIRKVPRKYLQLFSHNILKVVAIFYRGNKVACPVCRKTFSKFVPYGRNPPRNNALCPNCLALERHRLMWLFLKERTDFFSSPLKVLHVAPEICFIKTFEALDNLDYITADIESPLAKVKMDIHQIPFPDSTFDVAFCNHVMEHVEDDILAMRELNRVLKPGGWAIIQSPMDHSRTVTYEDKNLLSAEDREKAHGQKDHLRTYGQDYPLRLEESGFKVTPVDLVQEKGKDIAERYALPHDEVIYLCHK